ncbi:hypothetical protein MuYL_3548 [Mucilaginibacter xinganensis]|uniref:Uncharacterized protein n=1 Tax=Mucilaginibacter xinganensis TaxID=1234841 RepID=A0A223NZY9_9SPHI|nr:hypothetical protein MuYL_3548 [Mucilaginibacter xinganensis]
MWGTGLLALLLLAVSPKQSKAQGDEYISDQEFYDDLEPDGTWISDPQYGNVWVPNAEEGFRPYATRGHWVMTDYGNTWVSDYRWGWATFHYGRWRYDDYYGWEWIPGHTWAPAWVSWRHGGGYYGWAPLQPGISINISLGGGYHVPDNYWVCAPQEYINRPNIYNYYVAPQRSVTIIRNTTIINNTYVNNNVTYIAGPRRDDVRRYTRQEVPVYKINNDRRPGAVRVENNTLNIYRPAVNRTPNAQPARVVDANAYRQQNPNQAIAHRGNGAPAYNRVNAGRLAQAARDPRPDNKVVRVNPVPNRQAPPAGRPAVNPGQQRQEQQVQQRQQPVQQRQQQEQQRQQPIQQRQQQEQQRQQPVQQRQQQEQQRQQPIQQRQQQEQQRQQQQAQQRQQQQAQQVQQRQQQQAQQRQQQQAQQVQQRQQQQAQQRQQQQEQQVQQRQQQQAQQRQQQEQQVQQRQQQQAQQRQQQQAQQVQQRQQQQAQQHQQQQQHRPNHE